MDYARIRWIGKRHFVGTDQSGHGVVMDAKPEHGGEGLGIRPVELVLQGLAGCTAMDVVSLLEKKRQDVRGVEVNVTGVQREEYPKIYTDITVEYVVSGFDVAESAVARAIELSEDKYCSVKGMLGEGVKITSSYRVVQMRPAGVPLLETSDVKEKARG